jgi:HrpA-like RNA helicase
MSEDDTKYQGCAAVEEMGEMINQSKQQPRTRQEQSTHPIQASKEQLLKTVRESPITILVAETGAGKSTQVAQYLVEAGFRPAITQPRVLAARSVATRVAEEAGEKLGQTYGLRTSQDCLDSPDTKALFCTDGLAVVRELIGKSNSRDILVIDEVHEWNINIEVLVAWAKNEIARGAKFKLVLMSATVDAERLSAYCDNAPVISVPGRLYPIEEREPQGTIVDSVTGLVREGRNVLVFQPGKAEIEQTTRELKARNLNAEILPLHGELGAHEQGLCYKRYQRPKVIVATNVAQTSITIADIDAVVDSGLEKRLEVIDGVEGLYLRSISLADSKQRKGRAGRTKPGIYIDFNKDPDRKEFLIPEIERVRLDMTFLRLAMANIDMSKLEFFHQPKKDAIAETRRSLIALGCYSEEGTITDIGRHVAKLPLSANVGRMVVEAQKRGVLADVITLAAILEVGGIVSHKSSEWKKLIPEEKESDLLANMAVFNAAHDMRGDDFARHGIFAKSYFRAKDIVKNIRRNALRDARISSTGDREQIIRCICSGMVDHLYRSEGRYSLKNGGPDRELNKASVLELGYDKEWIVGVPFDLEITIRRGTTTLNLVTLATKVTPELLQEVAPQLVTEAHGAEPKFNPHKDLVESISRTYFNKTLVSERTVDDPHHPQAAAAFANWVMSASR